ncbi:hypothetical protein [Bacteroides ovatus]|uniref:hypothetical protein n=1 Tax=Bacteroides ovatus TaxID=28116 RepID=UPI00216AC578|nr:hypothetical protein [Bacteroides ovatus]
MAILSNGKFYGFLCSVKETGRKLTNGVKEYVEDFVSGFAGHGWKLWEYMTGKWKLEIDTIVVRETMLVFEMLISKIRAIIGAQTISQGHGKVKSARISDDGTEYLIVLEDEDMSIVAHDFVRCQTFVGDKTKLYHVEVDSVDVETKTLHIPLSEFDVDESGKVLNPPAAGDELVQFGNSQNKARQSAIYLHADETGQPAIDVMFDIDSKNWDGKVKVRMGGNIPGGNGLKGFYSVNGMVKAVDDKGVVIYELSPDGSVNLGKGNIVYSPATNKVSLGSGVTLTWNNLDSESKANLKGEPGKDGESGRDGLDGINGKDGNDGLDIVWKGDSSIPPASPQKNWVYRDTDNGRVYIYNGTVWTLMVADGNDGIDGTNGEPGADGKDGKSVYITYNDSEEEPKKPTGDGTTEGWHTDSTASVIWISQKVAESADSGEWGKPINIKGEPGKDGQDANLLPWVEDWDNNKTQIGSEHIISPKMFAGTNTGTSDQPVLTGIALGRRVVNINGIYKTVLFGIKNGKLTFGIDAETGEAIFRGKVITGAENGKRIEISPETSDIKMFKADGTIAGVFDGNEYMQMDNLFDVKAPTINLTLALPDYKQYISASNNKYTEEIVEVLLSDLFETQGNVSMLYMGKVQIYQNIVVNDTTGYPVYSFGRIKVGLNSYRDSAKNELISTSYLLEIGSSQNGTYIDYKDDATMIPLEDGYHQLFISYQIYISPWLKDTKVLLQLVNFTARTVYSNYVSKYYANGLTLGTSSENLFSFQNNSNGVIESIQCNPLYGIKFNGTNLLSKRQGRWGILPSIVCAGRYYSSNSSLKCSSYDGNSPTFYKMGTGRYAITLPSKWVLEGVNPTNCYVTLTGIDMSDEASSMQLPVGIKATLWRWNIDYPAGVYIVTSDCSQIVDGNFLFEIKSW